MQRQQPRPRQHQHQQQRWRPPSSELEAAAGDAPPPPPEFWELSNGGVTPHPLFLQHLESCVRRGSWRAIQLVMSHGAREGAAGDAHARVALAAAARALGVAAATALCEGVPEQDEERHSSGDSQRRPQLWARPWWDRRPVVRPVSVLFPAAADGEDGGREGDGEGGESAARAAWAAHEASAVFLFMRHFARAACETEGAAPDLVTAAGILNAFSKAGFVTAMRENPLGPSRRQLWWVLDSILDASLAQLRGGADARAARLVLSAQLAAARVGVTWASNTTAGRSGPGTAVGACMRALDARGAMALLYAWRARNGTVTADNAALLYAALEGEGAAADARRACPMRAAREVALLANLPLQPPPATYLAALLAALAAPGTDAAPDAGAEGPSAAAHPAALSLSESTQVELLGALAAQHCWGGAAVRLEDWGRLVSALLSGLLADKWMRPGELERVLFALKRLRFAYAYSPPPGLSGLVLERVQRAAPLLSLHHLATACSALLSLGVKPSQEELKAIVRSANARLGELPQTRSWDGKVISMLTQGLTALGYSRVWLEGAGAANLFTDLFTRGVACLQSGTMPPQYVASWLRGLRRLRPEAGVSPPQTLLLLNALAGSLSATVAGRHGRARSADAEEGSAGDGAGEGDEPGEAREEGAADASPGRWRRARPPPSWGARELVDALYAANALGLNSSGVTAFWRAVREFVSASLPDFQPDQLAGVVVCMGAAGHKANAAALDTQLLPALEPAFRALVERARRRADAEAAGAQPVQQQPEHQQEEQQQQILPSQQQQQQQQSSQDQHQQQQQEAAVLSASLLARLPSALASLGMNPRPQWWRLYQAALVASLPDLTPARLATALGAAADLALPAPAAWTRILMRALPEQCACSLEPRHQATLLAALGHLADGADGDASVFDAATVQALWLRVCRVLVTGGSVEEEEVKVPARGEGGDTHQHQHQQQKQQAGQDGSSSGPAQSEPHDGDDGLHAEVGQGGGGGPDAALTACELLRAGGRLQQLSAALAPPDAVVARLLEASEPALAGGLLPPRTVGWLARSVAILGAQPSAEWMDRLQDAAEASLDRARPADLAALITALCSLGVQPRAPLLERLLSFGPSPDFSPRLMADLHGAITALLGDGGGTPPKRRRGRPRTTSESAGPPAPWSAALDAPPEGAAPEEFDAFVDAARAHLGASDSSLDAPEPAQEEGGVGASNAPATGPNSLWRFALGQDGDAEAEGSQPAARPG